MYFTSLLADFLKRENLQQLKNYIMTIQFLLYAHAMKKKKNYMIKGAKCIVVALSYDGVIKPRPTGSNFLCI